MKSKWTIIGFSIVGLLILAVGPSQAQRPVPQGDVTIQGTPLGTAFTYQGQLKKDGNPVNGTCDFRFSLWNAGTGGVQIGTTQTRTGVTVTNGLFTISDLDFGAVFTGDARWLEIAVRCPAGSGDYTTLLPRQVLTATPYAIYALRAPWGGLTGVPPGFADGVDNDTTTFWSLTGNSGTTPDANFIGTTDNQALEIRVNNGRALRIEPNPTSPNLIGGYSGNSVTGGVVGATVGGGGASGTLNRVTDDYGTVGGGAANRAGDDTGTTADRAYATVGGGLHNTASGKSATIAGGEWITASGNYATVGGGLRNTAGGNLATIGGGQSNTASRDYATVGGGLWNTASGGRATVGGGLRNTAIGDAATIGGGEWITASGNFATVGGGYYNTASGWYATVGGGLHNTVSGKSATVAGGEWITASGNFAAVGGGGYNTASGNFATIGGGQSNTATDAHATVGGGIGNTAGYTATVSGGGYNTASGDFATIGGGFWNTASGGHATVSGGRYSKATGWEATVGGGGSNTANGWAATVGGGYGNTASDLATVGGGRNNMASGRGATIPGGDGALASHHGEMAYAAGVFSSRGDAQGSLYVMRRGTTGIAWTDLFLDGSSALLTVAPGRTLTFDILIVGRSNDGESAGYIIRGVIENVGGTVSFIGAPGVTELGEDDAAWDAQVVADDINDALLVQVRGNGETIRWVAVVRTAEVAW